MEKIQIQHFLADAAGIPVIDVRSPSEFRSGHIPGALNIPLFDDNQREEVGIVYKKEGRKRAVMKGLELTGPSMHLKLEEASRLSEKGKLLVYCFRGGMRSEAMAWLFSLGGIECRILEGGYKAYRNHILSALGTRRKIIILGGLTGSSKTHMLRHLSGMGQQIIDLEKIANHKGSAFGALGEKPQPTTEHFANLLYNEWRRMDESLPVWLEDESRNIGTVFMPDSFYFNMQEAPAVVLMMPVRSRIPRLLLEYSKYPGEELKASIMKISRRLGGDNTKEALKAVDNRDFSRAIEITLEYYDKTYLYGLSKKNKAKILMIETETDDIELNAVKVLEASQKISW